MGPLVSVITPHRPGDRYDWIFDRCMASVRAQTYRPIEHVIVSDGPDPELAAMIEGMSLSEAKDVTVIFDQLPPNPDPRWGTRARVHGLEIATADLIAYLDDDDSYRPDHIACLVKALHDHPEAGMAYTRMASHGMKNEIPGGSLIGSGELGPCAIGTPMMMHRKELLKLATWGPPDPMEDWRLVDRWMERGVVAYFVNEVTVDVWPSAYRGIK